MASETKLIQKTVNIAVDTESKEMNKSELTSSQSTTQRSVELISSITDTKSDQDTRNAEKKILNTKF